MSKLKYNIYLHGATKTFGDRGFEVMLAVVLSMGSLFLLMFFPVAGFALMAFSYGFLCVGTKSFLLGVAKGEFLPIETVFSKIRISVKAFCLKVATLLVSFLWSVVFVVPGIVTTLNYSMASFVMADDNNLSAMECMVKSKKLVYGHRGEIFVLYLAYLFITIAIMSVCAGVGCAMKYYFNFNYWIPIVSMGLLALFLIVIFVIPYFELTFAHVYLVLKQEKEVKKVQNETSQLKSTQKNRAKSATSNKNV